MNKKIIRNARIITMNERLDILPNGNILIENGKISAITTQSLEDTDAEITDAEGMFLLPGLINTHTHLPMTMLGVADDLPLHEWLTSYIFRQKPGYDS
ncbi:MAG: amidohydrolase family protein [Odoribacter splanchnicus]